MALLLKSGSLQRLEFNDSNQKIFGLGDNTGLVIDILEDISGSLPCSQASSYNGGESYPTEEDINLGETTGSTNLQFNAQNVPDRFIVEWNRNIVIDSGYRGSSVYGIGGNRRSDFTSALNGKIDPVTRNTYAS